MKILHTVSSYDPSPGGMQEVVKQLSERLVKAGHEVSVATSQHPERKDKVIHGVRVESFAVFGNAVDGLTGDVESYRDFLLNSDFDIVTNFAAQQWATDIALPLLPRMKAKKVFVPTGFSGLYLPKYQFYFEQMKAWMKAYDMNVFLSGNYRDINFAKENKIEKQMVIPNGASEDEFLKPSVIDIRKKLGIAPDAFLILHVGSYSGRKGQAEACSVFLRSNIKNAVLLLIGNDNAVFEDRYWYKVRLPLLFKSWSSKGKRICITHDLNRLETVAAYHAADLFLFPSNIECSPIVLFECMASHTPFLTTDVGNAKEIIEWSGSGELLPTTFDKDGFSHADQAASALLLEAFLQNPEKRKQMADLGFEAWKKNFTWEIIAGKYEALYTTL